MKMDWPLWIQEQDTRIKSAQGNLVKIDLNKLNLKQIPRAFAVEIADLARRLNLSYLILRILYSIVYSETQQKNSISDRELALYALGLARIGAHRESAEILKNIHSTSKTILLLKASALVSQWNYKDAQQIYIQLLESTDLNEYERLIANINMASCLVHIGNYKRAIFILKEFDFIKNSYKLLYGNSLELLAQALLGNGNYAIAEDTVLRSISILDEGDSDYSLFAKKWLLIIRGFQKNLALSEWKKIKDLAVAAEDFETRRDLELFHSCITKNKENFLKVYFGTPFKSYRIRSYRKFSEKINFPRYLNLKLNESDTVHDVLDLNKGLYSSNKIVIRIPKGNLIFLRALACDLYRPIPTGQVFSIIYPNQRFDVYSSPHRLYQRVRSVRKYLEVMKIPIAIKLKKKSYALEFQISQLIISLSYKESVPPSFNTENFRSWLRKCTLPHFTRQDLEKQLGLSKSTVTKCLNEGLVKKWIKRSGAGNNYCYFLLPKAYK